MADFLTCVISFYSDLKIFCSDEIALKHQHYEMDRMRLSVSSNMDFYEIMAQYKIATMPLPGLLMSQQLKRTFISGMIALLPYAMPS